MKHCVVFRRGTIVVAVLLICGAAHAGASNPPYATKIYIGRETEISLYSPTMFRIRISEAQPERFPAKYEIPFVMGRLAPWPEVKYKRWAAGELEWIETSALRLRVDKACKTSTVWSADGTKLLYPSDGPIRGMSRDGYTVFDATSAFGERNLNSRYAHCFYNFQTRRYVDTFLAGDLILDEFFIYGPGYGRLFQQLNDLVGPEPLLPKKAYGFFQTEENDCQGSQTKLLDLARKLRDHDIPVDTLILDFEWGDGCPGGQPQDWGKLDWDPAYSQPLSLRDMLAQLHAMHYDVMLIHHNAPNFPHRAEFTPARPGNWTSKVYDEGLWWEKIRGELAIRVEAFGRTHARTTLPTV